MKKLMILLLLFLFFFLGGISYASEIDEIKSRIEERNEKIKKIEKEIEEYEGKIEEVQEEKNTLNNAVKILDTSSKKLSKDLANTRNKVYTTELNIEKIGIEISDKEKKINQNNQAVSESLRRINEADKQSLVEIILQYKKISEFWETVQRLEEFQIGIKENLEELQEHKTELFDKKLDEQEKKRELVNLKSDIEDKKKIVDYNKYEKDKLLKETQNKESNYKSLLDKKLEQKIQFERELNDLEAELKIAIDPNSYPSAKFGILSWPIDKVFITQYFGDTEFSRTGAYNGRGHNGIDFRASTGNKVRASGSGVVVGTGNTDLIRGCYSYGKWILIKHSNGLSTLYAHLSLIKVDVGETVNKGDIIGYSGNTGYSTGPHLHYTVYASEGVRIERLGNIKKITNCADARIPIAPLKAYLNPLNYLPEL